ncbi:MAG: hypothetical protein IT290_11560 [Deltaproteobacteria bacterium]|nr:hypothetical protein [Deltaproteobacteria bacterium]
MKLLRIAFVADKCIPVHARSLDERPLGGTETGLIRIAEEFVRLGHDVVVFTSLPEPVGSIPRYLPLSAISSSQAFDVAIAVKDWRSLYSGVRAQKWCYWTGDGAEQYSTFGVGDRRVEQRIHALFCASSWHRETLCAQSGFDPTRAKVVGNGVHLAHFLGGERRSPRRLIFTSAPYRGLQFMPRIFSALKRKYADLELHVFSGMKLYDTDRPFEGPHKDFEREISAALSKLAGVYLY